MYILEILIAAIVVWCFFALLLTCIWLKDQHDKCLRRAMKHTIEPHRHGEILKQYMNPESK